MQRGKFITFEGGEGSGKSTQIKLLAEALAGQGEGIVTTREPGGTKGAEAIRNLLVTGEADSWDAMTETLLFLAARRDHIRRLIEPALAVGKTVLCDRFIDSTLVYQGIGKGLGVQLVHDLHRLAIGECTPDLTFILDIDPQIGLQRAKTRRGDETRFEGLNLAFHQSIREGFLTLASASPGRYVVVDASASVEEVHQCIMDAYSLKIK